MDASQTFQDTPFMPMGCAGRRASTFTRPISLRYLITGILFVFVKRRRKLLNLAEAKRMPCAGIGISSKWMSCEKS
jgi:hypothetical protein